MIFNIPLTHGASPIIAAGDTFFIYTPPLTQANILCGLTYASGGWVTSGTPGAGQSYNPAPTVNPSVGPTMLAVSSAFGGFLNNIGGATTPAGVRQAMADMTNWIFASAGDTCFTPFDSPVRRRRRRERRCVPGTGTPCASGGTLTHARHGTARTQLLTSQTVAYGTILLPCSSSNTPAVTTVPAPTPTAGVQGRVPPRSQATRLGCCCRMRR